MNASSSVVAFSAAKIRSPSFSRFSSSTTTTGRPSAISAIARSMAAKSGMCGLPGKVRCHQFLHVLGQHVDLEVDHVTGLLEAERGEVEGGRDERHRELAGGAVHHGQRGAVDRDRALLHE